MSRDNKANIKEGFIRTVWGWLLLFILGIAALVKGYAIDSPIEDLWSESSIMLNGSWEKTYKENQWIVEYQYTIEESQDETLFLCFKTYLPEFEVYLDDDRIYSFSDRYGMKGGSQHLIRIPEGSHGKTITLTVENAEKYEKWIDVDLAWIGEEKEALFKLLADNLYALIFSVFIFLMGIVSLIVAVVTGRKLSGEMRQGLRYLNGFIFISSIWVLTDSELLLFATDKVAIVSFVSFVSFMIMPACIFKFVNSMFGKRKWLERLCRLLFVVDMFYMLNYLSPVIPGYLFLLPVHLMCFCGIAIALKIGHEEMKDHDSIEAKKVLKGFWLLSIFSFVAFIVYYINPALQYSLFYCIGIVLFIICLMEAAIRRLYGQVEENANVAAYKRLAYIDTMTGMGNRTAFMEEHNKDVKVMGCTYILLDINNLKFINDKFGHQAGDLLIVAAAQYIWDAFGKTGKCYRIGGDEFVVILKESSKVRTARILSGMQELIEKENKKRVVPLSIAAGFAVREHEDETAEWLFRQADKNMYVEKKKMKKAEENSCFASNRDCKD